MMKRATKIAVICGSVLLAAGLILFFCGMATEGWDFSSLSTVKYEQREYTAQADVTELAVNINAANIRAEVSEETEKISVSYPVRVDKDGNVLAEMAVTEENGTLSLTEESGGWDISFDISFESSPVMTVKLPAEAMTEISLCTKAGNISLSGVQAEQISCVSDTGNITAENIRAEQLALTSDTGNVRVSGANAGGDASFRADTGNVRAENITAGGTLAAETDTGGVTLAGTVEAENIEVRTQFGNISAEAPLSARAMRFETDTGEIDLLLCGEQAEYTVIAETDTGNSNIASAIGGEKTLTVRTGTGNIRVGFVQ